ncbi:MAG TPA: methyltransferase, partial [Firmicutes bacterium]|nr:methyltransferase [Bacillota bacterium]
IGLEREIHGYAAGLRTHMLVGVGAALFTIVSEFAFKDSGMNSDPARIAAQVVPGIGFIGAGAIIQNGVSVKGLTTATTLWISAAIGMCAGSGLVFVAIIATAVAIIVLVGLKSVENRFGGKKVVRLAYVVPKGSMTLGKVTRILDDMQVLIKDVEIGSCRFNNDRCTRIVLTIKSTDKLDVLKIMDEITGAITPLALEQIK